MSILGDLFKIDKNDDEKIDEFLGSLKRVDMTKFPRNEKFDEEDYRLLLKSIIKKDFTKLQNIKKTLILPGADLRGTDLRGADLFGTDLRGADLRGADLRRTNLFGTDLFGTNLRGADLRETDLRETDLREADLFGANLFGANLRGANLRGADLFGTNLSDKQRDYVRRKGAILDDIINDVERDTNDRHLENLIQRLNNDLADQKAIYEKNINNLKATQEKNILNAVKAELKDLEEKRKEEEENVQKAQTKYIDPSIKELKKRKLKMHLVAFFCFLFGVASLILACWWIYDDFGFYTNHCFDRLIFLLGVPGNCTNMTEVIVRSTRLVAGVLILAALAKFFYLLGKSFMHEAVKCSDRIHAINFGQFFLQAFPIPETHRERREIFSEWNRESHSSFFNMKPGDIDPRLVEAINALRSIHQKDDSSKE